MSHTPATPEKVAVAHAALVAAFAAYGSVFPGTRSLRALDLSEPGDVTKMLVDHPYYEAVRYEADQYGPIARAVAAAASEADNDSTLDDDDETAIVAVTVALDALAELVTIN